MADGILYVDVDDEITSAAARIRRSEGSRVVLVFPYGSKVATSRINFRLLAREAGVEPDPGRWPRLARALLFGPQSPASFRLDGPDALPDAARRVRKAVKTKGIAA